MCGANHLVTVDLHAADTKGFFRVPVVVRVDGKGWPKRRVVSVAPLIMAALQRLLADGSLADFSPA